MERNVKESTADEKMVCRMWNWQGCMVKIALAASMIGCCGLSAAAVGMIAQESSIKPASGGGQLIWDINTPCTSPSNSQLGQRFHISSGWIGFYPPPDGRFFIRPVSGFRIDQC